MLPNRHLRTAALGLLAVWLGSAATPGLADMHEPGYQAWARMGLDERQPWQDARFFSPVDPRVEGRVQTFLVDAWSGGGESGLVFGPLLQYRSMREAFVGDPATALPEREPVLEGGAYLVVGHGPWSFSGAFASDLSDRHGGTLFDISIRYNHFLTDNLRLVYGANTSWANSRYLQAYFGNDGAPADASHFSGDFHDIGLSLSAWYRLGEHWSVVGTLNADRTLGAAADYLSSGEEGGRNRIRAGGALNYRF